MVYIYVLYIQLLLSYIKIIYIKTLEKFSATYIRNYIIYEDIIFYFLFLQLNSLSNTTLLEKKNLN